MVTEPDVTFTDFFLALECLIFAFLILKYGKHSQPLRNWFFLFFVSIAISALTGGIVHGFFNDRQTLGYTTLWPATLIAIGFTAFTIWVIASHISFSTELTQRITRIAALSFLVYCFIVVFFVQAYLIAIVYYLPAVVFLLIIMTLAYRRYRANRILVAIFGLVLGLIAAVIQQGKIGLHPVYFNHNALYHVVQSVALFMIFLGSLWFTNKEQPSALEMDST